jgi:hypothetical protein
LKEEALDRTKWRNRFGRGFGPVVRQNIEWMNMSSWRWQINLTEKCWTSNYKENVLCKKFSDSLWI